MIETPGSSSRGAFWALVLCLVLLAYPMSCVTGDFGEASSSSLSKERSADNEFRSCTDGKCMKRTMKEIAGGMWFGPRLGKRRKSAEKIGMIAPGIETFGNEVDGERWALINVPCFESDEDAYLYGKLDDFEDEQPTASPRRRLRFPWEKLSSQLARQLRVVLRRK